MKRLFGPYPHRKKWRAVSYDYDTGARRNIPFASREDALAAIDRNEVAMLAGDTTAALATAMLGASQELPPNPTWIYFLLNEAGEPVYVGITGSPSARLAGHRAANKEFARVAVFPRAFSRDEAVRLEVALVAILRPSTNRALKREIRGTNRS